MCVCCSVHVCMYVGHGLRCKLRTLGRTESELLSEAEFVWMQTLVLNYDSKNLDLERRVRRCIAVNRADEILAKCKESCLSSDMMQDCTASDLAAELGIQSYEAESLTLSDSTWNKSLFPVLLEMLMDLGDCSLMGRACTIISDMAKSPKDLMALSEGRLREIP